MKQVPWFERQFDFGKPKEMLPYYLERLDGTAARLETLVKGIDEQLLCVKPDSTWSVKENIGHLGEVDEIANRRIDEMLSGMEIMSPAVFEPVRNYNAMRIDEVLAFFRKCREANLKRYRSLSDYELQQSSVHPRLKVKMTPVDLAWFDAEHDDHHLVKIREIIFILKQTRTA